MFDLNAFYALDARLAARGIPAISGWWADVLRDFLRSGKRRLVLRVGRRGGKSTMLAKLAIAYAVLPTWPVPPGECWYVTIASVSRDEAAARLRLVRAGLDALGIAYEERGDVIEIPSRRVGIKVITASIAGASGWTALAFLGDEMAKWTSPDDGRNPAHEVAASANAMLATTRGPSIFSSSPLGLDDYHAQCFETGHTDHQMVAYAPTWTANPSITEADTRQLEPDDRIWRREYYGEPQAAVLGAFDTDAINRGFVEAGPAPTAPVMVNDASSGRKDSWAWCVAGWFVTPERRILRVTKIGALTGSFWRQTPGAQVVARIAAIAAANKCREVFGDQREALMLESEFRRYNLRYRVMDWTATSKPAAVARVRRWLADGVLAIDRHEDMRKELLRFEERITPSGAFTFGARGSGHDDYVALLITLAMADEAGLLRRSGVASDPKGRINGGTIEERPILRSPFLGDGQSFRPRRNRQLVTAEERVNALVAAGRYGADLPGGVTELPTNTFPGRGFTLPR